MAKAHHYAELVERSFTYHRPSKQDIEDIEFLRDEAKILARSIANLCPQSAEAARALAKLRECLMWANAAIVCYPTESRTEKPDA